jgi:hypothetical protein
MGFQGPDLTVMAGFSKDFWDGRTMPDNVG